MSLVAPPRARFRRRAATARNHRVYAVGDIHGRFDLFSDLIDTIEADNARRADHKRVTLVLLGDVIDRGPSSQRLIRMMMALQRRNARLTVLLGNHEAMLLESLAGKVEAQEAWLRYGGLATLESFAIEPPLPHEDGPAFAQRLAEGLTPAVVEWLEALPLSITCGDYFFCHAGVRPGTALARQRREDLLWIRQPFLRSRRHFGAVVVHGHTIVDEVTVESNRIAVDTGAYATGVLSAVCLDGTEIDVFATVGAPGDSSANESVDRLAG